MKSSLIILAFFVLGCLSGLYFTADFDIHEASVGVLYILMLLLGINLGCNQDIKGFAKMINFKMLLVPIATVTGTFLFSAIAGFILSQWSVFDCMAVGSGFAYYSISSVLITQLKTPSIGMQLATELGTIALLANIFREMTALIGAPFIRKYFGRLAPISAAGIGSSDILLASISKYSGQEAIPLAILHGILINISVPFFVSLFCNL
ncbi:LysO family transporter [Dysgonomonas mossii]|uniref:lysine exporter LysO family protein n=1 Tax=Dysgonomonas mossii TaxID=163665 RepID=UPI0015AFD748